MANGDQTMDFGLQGPNILKILQSLSVAPKAPAQPTLDVSMAQPQPAAPVAQPQAPHQPQRQPEDPTQKVAEMLTALLGNGTRQNPGMIPQQNISTQRRPADWILGAVAPLAAGVASAMSGPIYRSRRNFIAGLAGTAPQAVAGLLEAPAQRRAQQAELNQQRFKTAAEIMRGMAPLLRTERPVVAYDENNNPVYFDPANAVGRQPAPIPKQQNFPPTKGYDAQGNEVEARFDPKLNRWKDTNSDSVIQGFVQPVGRVTADRDLVLAPDGKTFWREYHDSQGKLVRVDKDVQVPALMPKTIRKVDIRTVPQSDGSISLIETPVQTVETKGPAAPTAPGSTTKVGARSFPVGHRASTNYDKQKVDNARAFQVSDGVVKTLKAQGIDPAKDPVTFYQQAASAVIQKASDPRASQSDRALVKPILDRINTELSRQYPAEKQAINAAHKQTIEKSLGMTSAKQAQPLSAPTEE